MEEEWGTDMDREDEVESRKKLDEQERKLQKEQRDSRQQQLQELEQRRHDLVPEHQKVQKRSQKMQSIHDKRRNMHVAAEEKMRKLRDDVKQKEESIFFFCRTKTRGTRWLMQKWKHNFKGCTQERKKEAATLRKRWLVAWRRWWNSCSLWEQIRRGLSSMLCAGCSLRDSC